MKKSAQICDRCSLKYFAMISRFYSRGRTHGAGNVTRIAFKYMLAGFRINFFQKWFPCPLFCVCLFIHNSRSKHSRKATAQTLLQWDCDELLLSMLSVRVHLFEKLSIFLSQKLFLIETVVGLKIFYPKSFRKQFCAFLKAANFI